MSLAALSRKSQTPESTLRKLLQGVTLDPRISTVHAILSTLGMDANEALFGHAPPVPAHANEDALHQQLAHAHAELDRLRKLVLAKGEAMGRLESRAADAEHLSSQCAQQRKQLDQRLQHMSDQAEELATMREKLAARERTVANLESIYARKRREIIWLRVAVVVLVVFLAAICSYLMWEIFHPDAGLLRLESFDQK